MEQLLSTTKTPNTNADDLLGSTSPLHSAVKSYCISDVNHLLDTGADINVRDCNGRTPLHVACRSGMGDMLRLLVARGADVCATDMDGRTPLHEMFKEDECDIVNFRMDTGHYIDSDDFSGTVGITVGELIKLSKENTKFCSLMDIECLIRRGADVCAQDVNGRSPLHDVMRPNLFGRNVRYFNVVHLIIDKAPVVHGQDINGRTALHECCKYSNIYSPDGECERQLIDKGADVSVQDKDGRTPLHDAACVPSATVHVLLDEGADVNARDKLNRTAFHEAAIHEETFILMILLKRGVDPYVRDAEGKTAMQYQIDAVVNHYNSCRNIAQILEPFLWQHDLPVDWFSTGIFGSEHLLASIVPASNDPDDIIAFLRLVQCGCGIDRQNELDTIGRNLVFREQFQILLYLIEAGLYPNMTQIKRALHDQLNSKVTREATIPRFQCISKLTEVKSLQILCRDMVRQTIFRCSQGREIVSAIQGMLDIPQSITSFLTLSDLRIQLSEGHVIF